MPTIQVQSYFCVAIKPEPPSGTMSILHTLAHAANHKSNLAKEVAYNSRTCKLNMTIKADAHRKLSTIASALPIHVDAYNAQHA